MTTEYRACYFSSSDGQGETVLTGPEHAELTDEALIAEAVAEAKRANLIGDSAPHLSEDKLRAGLRIGAWRD